jgi:hypothetical protein
VKPALWPSPSLPALGLQDEARRSILADLGEPDLAGPRHP